MLFSGYRHESKRPVVPIIFIVIILALILTIIMVRDIVVKAIDLWCKPDTPEDNFDEDASGWGSGEEVSIIVIIVCFEVYYVFTHC